MLAGRFGPARGIVTRVVSAGVVKGPILHFCLIFLQNLTPAHLSIHTYIIMHTLSLSNFGQNIQRPKWLTMKIGRNDPPTKSEMTHPLNLDETTHDKSTQHQNDPHSAVSHNLIPNKFLSMKLFPSFTEPVFVSSNFCLLRCRFVIWISWVKNLEPLVNGPAPKKIIILLWKLIIFSFSLEFMHTLESRPTSFFHRFEIRIIECEHNRNHVITSCVFFLSFLGLFCFNLYFRCHFVWIFAKLCLLVDWVL